MTEQAKSSQYMRNVKWTTAGIVFTSTMSVIITIVWFAAEIKSDIKDSKGAAHNELSAAVDSIKINAERTQHKNDMNFQSIWNEIKNIENKAVVKQPHYSSVTGYKDPITGITYYKPVN